jgi:hypothetical protein
MKVKFVWTLLIIYCCGAVAIQPSTFGSAVDSFGRITNSIKVKYACRVQEIKSNFTIRSLASLDFFPHNN